MQPLRTTAGGLALALAALLAVFLSVPGPTRAGQDDGSAAVGRTTYRPYCTSCHGPEGKGDGKLAEALDPKPTDLTLLAQRNGGVFPAERVRQIIDGRTPLAGHRRGEMPAWGKVFEITDSQSDAAAIDRKIADLLAYLREIQVADKK
jgi:mono/diheme cytochrome c family protein